MARYLMIRVETTAIAEKLLEKFGPVSSIEVVGMFASPTKFCECTNYQGRSIRSQKWGTWHCPECRLPNPRVMQTPRNLLGPQDLHPRFVDMHLSVREPFHNDPIKRYGQDVIDATNAQRDQAAEKIRRHKRRNRRQRTRAER